jgi:CheY-like chemotaxis protein
MLDSILKINPPDSRANRCTGFVLVVDDEEQNRSLLRDALEARGYEVEEAENGLHALQKIAMRLPDVILLDLMMPKMDGYDVCRRLRKSTRTGHVPILMLTALSERGVRLMGLRAGASDFLNKPIDIQDVILRVNNAADAKHLHDQLLAEQEKSERLLLNILPKAIAERMQNGENSIADCHKDATVLVANLVGFTSLSAHIDPWQIVQLLNEVFSAFDALVEEHGLEKIKSFGDCYMVAGGISLHRTDHAEASAELAIHLQEEIVRQNRQDGSSMRLRIGLCTGPVIAGVIGRKRFAYDLWSETVNLACRLESTGETGRVQVSESTYERLKGLFHFEMTSNSSVNQPCDPPAYWLGNRLVHPALIGRNGKDAA